MSDVALVLSIFTVVHTIEWAVGTFWNRRWVKKLDESNEAHNESVKNCQAAVDDFLKITFQMEERMSKLEKLKETHNADN